MVAFARLRRPECAAPTMSENGSGEIPANPEIYANESGLSRSVLFPDALMSPKRWDSAKATTSAGRLPVMWDLPKNETRTRFAHRSEPATFVSMNRDIPWRARMATCLSIAMCSGKRAKTHEALKCITLMVIPGTMTSAIWNSCPLASISECTTPNLMPSFTTSSESGRSTGRFDLQTWLAMGGQGDPAAAPPAEQDWRASLLLQLRGLAPWPTPARECA